MCVIELNILDQKVDRSQMTAHPSLTFSNLGFGAQPTTCKRGCGRMAAAGLIVAGGHASPTYFVWAMDGSR
jgi:hypothetical protein